MKEFEGKTAFVTGASRGLGERISLELINMGVYVVGTSRSGPSEALLPYIQSGQASYESADLPKNWSGVLEKIYRERGGFEIFVNNAGSLSTDFFVRTDPDKIDQEINLDLTVPLLIHRQWLAAGGQAHRRTPELSVNLCSISSFYAWPGGTTYQASKSALAAAVWGLRSMQEYLGNSADEQIKQQLGTKANLNVRFLAIYPDSTDTGMITRAEQESLYNIKGDLLPAEIVIDVIVKSIKGVGDYGKYDDIAILANPSDPRTKRLLKGIYAAFLPVDQETKRPVFQNRILEKIAGEEKLIKRESKQ